MNPSGKPVLIYDGDCGFCMQWVEKWRKITGDRVAYAPYQEVAHVYPDIPLAQFARAVHFIESSGKASRGAEAVFRLLATAPRYRWLLFLYLHLPGFARLSEHMYDAIARRRSRTSCALPPS